MEGKKRQPIGADGQLLICTPLIGRTQEELAAELAGLLPKNPDVIEWRADFFAGVADADSVIHMARKITGMAGDIPVIFTLRSVAEGGQATGLSDGEAIELQAAICRDTDVEYVDCELSQSAADIAYLRQAAQESATGIIASYHNFDHTPGNDFLLAKLTEAETMGFDVAKIAVMPRNQEDVLRLLSVTLAAKERLKVPLISIAMGEYGVISRIMGGLFGSSLTFAAGQGASAPGQIPMDDLRVILERLQQYTGVGFGNRWAGEHRFEP